MRRQRSPSKELSSGELYWRPGGGRGGGWRGGWFNACSSRFALCDCLTSTTRDSTPIYTASMSSQSRPPPLHPHLLAALLHLQHFFFQTFQIVLFPRFNYHQLWDFFFSFCWYASKFCNSCKLTGSKGIVCWCFTALSFSIRLSWM